jgi:hypothetical protein
VTIVIDFTSDDEKVIEKVIDLVGSSDQEVIDLVSLESSSEDASTGGSSSSSSDDSSSSFLPSWSCCPDGHWRQTTGIFDDCDGREEESKSTSSWYQDLVSRRPKKR